MSRKKTKNFKRFKESLQKDKSLKLSETGLNIKLSRNERFIEITGYPKYFISNYGRAISHKRSKYVLLNPQINGSGYYQYTLYNELYPKGEQIAAHRLVAEQFCKGFDPDFQNEVHHKDHDKLNNWYKNLIWVDKTLHSFLDKGHELYFMSNYANSHFVPITDLREVANKIQINIRAIGFILKKKPSQVVENMELFEFESGGAYPYIIAVFKPSKYEEIKTA